MLKIEVHNCPILFEEYSDFITDRFKDSKWHEHNATRCLIEHLNEGDVFFDVGANIGYYSLVASCFTDSVHAFDCNKKSCDVISSLFNLNGRDVTVNYKVVLNDNGSEKVATFDFPKPGLSLNTKGEEYVSVEKIRLDDYGIMPTFVKIDVEGLEAKVLEGMLNILSRGVKLMVEVHNKRKLKAFGYSFDDIYRLLDRYSVYVIKNFRSDADYKLIPIEEYYIEDENFMIYAE